MSRLTTLMTARQLQLETRNVAIHCARRGGCLVPMIALAHGLSIDRTKAILRRMAQPDVQNATLSKILSVLENKRFAASRPSKRNTLRTASL